MDGRRNGRARVNETPEHPDGIIVDPHGPGHGGVGSGESGGAAAGPRWDRRWIVLAAVALAVLAIAALWATRGDRETVDAPESAAPDAAAVDEPGTILDEVFPERLDQVTEPPTPDAAGASDAPAALQVTEAAWVRSAFDDLDFVVLIRNDADVAFGNVRVDAVFLDATGAELAREPFSYPLVEAGGELVVSGLRPIDPDAVAEIRVETSARGSLPDLGPRLEATEVSWEQDAAGTVTVTGSIVAATPTEFVSVVGVLRGPDGAFVGTAFAFVDAVTDEPRAFTAVGFPNATVADVDVHLTG